MRALFFVQQFWPYLGGLEVWASRLLPGLIQRGHEISVVTSHEALRLPDRERHQGVDILRLPLRAALESRDLRRLAGMRRAVADLKRSLAPDLVHVNLTGPIACLHPLTGEADGPPTLVSVHDPLEAWCAAPDSLFGQVLRTADWVTGDEPMTGPQQSYLSTLGREAGEPVPADLTKAEASEKIEELQEKTGRGQPARRKRATRKKAAG